MFGRDANIDQLILQQRIQFSAIVEMLAEAFDEFLARVAMALRTALFEAVDGGQRTDLAAQLPLEAEVVARQESTAEGIAHARRVDDLVLGHGRDVDRVTVRIQVGAVLAARDDQHLDVLQDLVQAPACLLGDQTVFIIIAEQEVRTLHVAGQFRTFEAQDLLAGIVQIFDAQLARFGSELGHGGRLVGRDHHQVGLGRQVFQRLSGGLSHRARIEGSDLGALAVGGGEERSGEQTRDDLHQASIHTLRVKPGAILAEVFADGGHHTRMPAEQGHAVGDVGRNAAALLGHRVHQERQADRRQALGQDLLFEQARERHQIVVCN